jgi:hypothetical protein
MDGWMAGRRTVRPTERDGEREREERKREKERERKRERQCNERKRMKWIDQASGIRGIDAVRTSQLSR